MRRLDYIINSLIVISWAASYLSMLAPANTMIHPFIFYDGQMSFAWYLYVVGVFARLFSISLVPVLINGNKLHKITQEVFIINLIIVTFEWAWFQGWFNNPFHIHLIWIKIISTGIIYFSIAYLRWCAKNPGRNGFNYYIHLVWLFFRDSIFKNSEDCNAGQKMP